MFLELGAELGGTTCVPVATSPDSGNVRWMGWSMDDSAGGPMTESSSALVCCTESAARSSSPMSVPAHCSLSPDLQRPGLVEVGNKLAGVGKLLDASRGDGGGRDGVRGAGGILAAGFLRGPQRVVSTHG